MDVVKIMFERWKQRCEDNVSPKEDWEMLEDESTLGKTVWYSNNSVVKLGMTWDDEFTSHTEVPIAHEDLDETSDDYEVRSLSVGVCGANTEEAKEIANRYFMEKIRTNFTSTSHLDKADRCSRYNVQQLTIRRKSDVAKLANLSVEEMAKVEQKPLNTEVVKQIFQREKEKEMQKIEDSMEGSNTAEEEEFFSQTK